MKKKISLLLLFFILPHYGCSKLSLGNPGDWTSRKFLETVFWHNYLQSLAPCNVATKWEKSYGFGNSTLNFTGIVKYKNNDLFVTGYTQEPLAAGLNFPFTGTAGVDANGFIMRVNGDNGDIRWIDYFGKIDTNSTALPVIDSFSNSEVVVSFIAFTEITGALSPKANLSAFGLARYDATGARKWHTYLDSADIGFYTAMAVDSNDKIHIFTRANGPGHAAFSDFPTASNIALGGVSDDDMLYGLLSSSGTPVSQKFISSTAADSPSKAIRIGENIYMGGSAAGNLNGFAGHPSLAQDRPFILRANTNQDISWITYRGGSGSSTTGSIESLTTDGTDLFSLGRVSETFGSPASAYQGISGTKNYFFERTNTSGVASWNTFLGSSTTTITEGLTIGFHLRSDSNRLYALMLGPNNNSRYTGLSAVETGTGSGIYQRVMPRMNATTGAYESVIFDSNYTPPAISFYPILKEICAGKMVRAEYKLVDLAVSSKTTMVLKVFPTKELP